MRVLLPATESPDRVDVHEWYGREWLDGGGIRANMIAGADGAGAADGLSAGLQTSGDNQIFRALRDLADVVVVGWSTARTEGYSAIDPDADSTAARTAFGLAPQLPLALITRSLSIDDNSPLLDSGATVLVTCAASDPGRRRALAERVEVLVVGDDEIDYGALRREFDGHGWTRVLCEGGPTILAQIMHAGALDELCLSITPVLTGPGAGRIVAGDAWDDGPRRMRLHGLLEEDGALFARYRLSR